MPDTIVPTRLRSVDAVRGFAVLGIFVMNVNGMALPSYAYVDPNYWGGAQGGDLLAWALAYALADGKMRMLFSTLFGASMGIVADAAIGGTPGPVALHYRRLGWLLLFGMIHAWLIWYGDVLVEYAVAGAVAFLGWRWPPMKLAIVALLLLLADIAFGFIEWQGAATLRAQALGPNPPLAATQAWAGVQAFAHPPVATILREIALYRGGFADALAARAPMTWFLQTNVGPSDLPATIAFMLLGLLLYRTGFLAGRAPRRVYVALIAIGYAIALPLYLPIVHDLLADRFDPVTMLLTDTLSLILRPWVALAHASVVILFMISGRAPWFADRLAAAGRMAFSNYLGTSLIVTTVMNGYGLGLYGRLSRGELWWVILADWAVILLWSKPWLDRYRYGPLEWLWRSLARWEWQPMKKAIAND